MKELFRFLSSEVTMHGDKRVSPYQASFSKEKGTGTWYCVFGSISLFVTADLVAEGNKSTVETSLHQDEQRDSDIGLFTGIGVGAGILAILIIILLVYLFLLIRR
mgnify:FL=1